MRTMIDPVRISDAERLFGELAVRLYMTSRRDLTRALEAQRHAREAGGDPSIGEVMVGLEMLSEKQVQAVLRAQEVYDEQSVETLYGKLAVKNGFITQSDLDAALKVQNRTGRRLRIGEVLVKKSFMSWEQHEAILAAQERLLAGIQKKREESARLTRAEVEVLEAEASQPVTEGGGAQPGEEKKVSLRPPPRS